jgi:hypothetical protein
MKSPKTYKLNISHSRRDDRVVEGDLAYLINYFSYTLLIGNSHKSSISTNPKTIKSLVNNLNKSFNIKEAACYERTYIDLVTESNEIKTA